MRETQRGTCILLHVQAWRQAQKEENYRVARSTAGVW